MTERPEFVLEMVRRGAQTAAVCTEPGMIALAAAKARSLAGGEVAWVSVSLSSGVMKNSLAVGLPGTARRGPEMAAALGAVGGDPEKGLEALGEISELTVAEAARLVDEGRVKAVLSPDRTGIYCSVSVRTSEGTAEATIEGDHTRFSKILVNGLPREDERGGTGDSGDDADRLLAVVRELPYGAIVDLAANCDASDIEYLLKGAVSAISFADRSAAKGSCWPANDAYGRIRAVGARETTAGASGGSLAVRARMRVAAAVYARMAGEVWPVLTSCGSGNQGLSVGIPVLLAARSVNAGTERGARALLIAHATNLYVKSFSGKISPLCGAVSAGAGVSAAVCWLMGGGEREMEGAIQTVLGNLYGMLCDGAKASCALKCASAVSEGILAGQMAAAGEFLTGRAGILGASLEETMATIGRIAPVLQRVDRLIIDANRLSH